jgi:hypothetical protein
LEESIMRAILGCGLAALVAAAFATGSARGDDPAPKKSRHLGQVRHVVLFKFKDGTSAEEIKKVEDAFRALPKKIPQIAGFQWGTNMSPEHLDQGFTHCFLLTFKTPADRDAYLPHPAHKEFGKTLRPHLDKVLVVDFVAKD